MATTTNTQALGPAWLKNGDLFLSVSVLGILVIMLLPLPRMILDLLLTVSITLSIVILLVSLHVRRPLDFSAFPSVLLVATLFRFALNIAATRLILLHGSEGQGAAGEVIRAFGGFVMGGNYTVGIVVFSILVIVNFVVITKGAGRIAEVAARFTLDAMPGKQMSIDADLNAGLIDEAEARRRRAEVAEEADFYGAMDGASKFVRGDAIASVIIILVNIVGGLTIGVLQQGLSVTVAAQNYTILTVGEGLVAQVPALLVSVAAGMVVTRAASESNLGADIARQIFMNPKTIGITAVLLLVLGLTPGLPHVAFLVLAAALGGLAYSLREVPLEPTAAPAPRPAGQPVASAKQAESVEILEPLDLMDLQVGYGLIGLVDAERGGELLERIKGLRKQIAQELGFMVPPVHIRDNLQLRPTAYAILIKGTEVVRGEVMTGHLLAIDPGTAEKGLEGIPTKEPTFGLPALWVPEARREQAQLMGYTVVDLASVITTHLTEVIRSHAHELLGRQETQALLDQVAKTAPKVVEDLIPQTITLGGVVRILGNLLRERVPIRDLRTIIETIADYAPTTKDTDTLTEYVRQALGRAITSQHVGPDGTLTVISLDPALDRQLSEAVQTHTQGSYLSIAPSMSQRVLAAVKQAVEHAIGRGIQPVLLCSPALRPHLRRLIERGMSSLAVLSLNEVEGQVRIQSLEVVRLADAH
ncbi:MAG TPA: flagellar biosynthesis protein FlhA [Nitrospirales bacterium]|nr:flagellar biosynthesis protein FlhA [Nitrospirales bacterium]